MEWLQYAEQKKAKVQLSQAHWLTIVSGLNQDPVVSYMYYMYLCFDICIACVNIQIDIQGKVWQKNNPALKNVNSH